MLLACLLFSLMNACVFAIKLFDAGLPASMISFVRILANLLILLTPILFGKRLSALFGDKRPSLWLRGLFGTLALMLSFGSIIRIGPGESAFLTASSGVFVAMLGPLVLGQKNSWLVWLAIIGSFAGVVLLFKPDGHSVDLLGRAMALLSGLLSALAYLMVARAGRSNSPQSVIFYFCLVALVVHLLYFTYHGYQLPTNPETWGILLLIGVLGSGAQFFMTRAYQVAPAALVSAVGYLAPVLSLAWGIAWLDQIPGRNALLGSLLILLFGVLLPFLR
ncbi:DMT family transporter [Methylomonas sp. LL1]|uniref:DMT family transporter n=1 Tax=Methylomonas sp. LL1 TaxID=2785785 RepID=UPI0018C3F24B|nr:DMT family transporter [Methylomonas sp. LL1]QPK65650.1 DMT family transporter [Methylomonas sp. LL1]